MTACFIRMVLLGVIGVQGDGGFRDVTDRLERFETPIPRLYGEGWDKIVKIGGRAIVFSGKQLTYDLQRYRDRIYIGHGSTNSKQKTFMLYFDPATSRYDVDRDGDGKPLEFPEECMAHLRVFDDELYVSSTDQLNGGTKFFRKNRDGSWTIRTVHKKQQHSRDFYKTGPHILIHFGIPPEPFPGTVYSPDNGKTWTVLSSPDLCEGPYLGYSIFFGFKDVCYMTRSASPWIPVGKGRWEEGCQPWILAFTGDTGKPFRVVCRTPADFHPEIRHGETPKPEPGKRYAYDGPAPARLTGGITVGGRLLLVNNGTQLFAVASFDPVKADLVAIPGSPLGDTAWRVADMLERPGSGYLLLTRREGEDKGYRARLVASTDGLDWRPVLEFVHDRRPRLIEEFGGDFYFGLSRSELLRVRRNAYSRN